MTHASSLVSGLRSVALTVPDLDLAEKFYTSVWRLDLVEKTSDALYFRGTGADHHLLALHYAEGPAKILYVTLRLRDASAFDVIAKAVVVAGGKVLKPRAALNTPGGAKHLQSPILMDVYSNLFTVTHCMSMLMQKTINLFVWPMRCSIAMM